MAEIPRGVYRHYKGGVYEVIGVAKHSESLEELVVYREVGGEGKIWARPIAMWNETVIHEGAAQKRFAPIQRTEK